MLTHWGDAVFCLWAVLLSARALFLFLSDGFVRYSVNEYNLRFHQDAVSAGKLLTDNFSFLSLFNLLVALAVYCVLQWVPLTGSMLFDVQGDTLSLYRLPLLVGVYLLVCGVQNGQRMLAATLEAKGLVRHNLMFETALIVAEVLLLSLLLLRHADFATVVWADIALIASMTLGYQGYLSRQTSVSGLFARGTIVRGGGAFAKASRLYLGNFFEKLSTDGLVLLLSLFRFPKISIALFSAMRTMVNAPLLAQNLLLNTYTPRLQQLFALRDQPGMQRLLTLARFYLGTVLLAGMILCIPLYQPVFLKWTGGTLPFDARFLTGMLLWCVFSIYGNGYLFVLKGLNLLREFWLLMALRCVLLLAGFFWSKGVAAQFVWVLCWVELAVSGILLPFLLRKFWQKSDWTYPYRADLILLATHGAAALLLYYFLY